jgi:hypothetical protein
MGEVLTMTNGDRIRAMTDEELAAYLTGSMCLIMNRMTCCNGMTCEECRLEWMKEEVKENDKRRQNPSDDGRGTCGMA